MGLLKKAKKTLKKVSKGASKALPKSTLDKAADAGLKAAKKVNAGVPIDTFNKVENVIKRESQLRGLRKLMGEGFTKDSYNGAFKHGDPTSMDEEYLGISGDQNARLNPPFRDWVLSECGEPLNFKPFPKLKLFQGYEHKLLDRVIFRFTTVSAAMAAGAIVSWRNQPFEATPGDLFCGVVFKMPLGTSLKGLSYRPDGSSSWTRYENDSLTCSTLYAHLSRSELLRLDESFITAFFMNGSSSTYTINVDIVAERNTYPGYYLSELPAGSPFNITGLKINYE